MLWNKPLHRGWSGLLIQSLHTSYCHVYECNYRRGLDWWMHLLTTYTHDWELQAITAPLLISTIHKSPQRPLSLFQPTVPSPAVPWQRLLIVEILQLHELRSSLHSLLYRSYSLSTELRFKRHLAYNLSARTTWKTRFFRCCSLTIALLRTCCLPMETCLPSRCAAMVAVCRVIV
jgi:hypothetical protein